MIYTVQRKICNVQKYELDKQSAIETYTQQTIEIGKFI